MSRCYCTATLRKDGSCPHGCDPAMRPPRGKGRRHAPVGKCMAREQLLSREEVRQSPLHMVGDDRFGWRP
jgi:hypothetical protein